MKLRRHRKTKVLAGLTCLKYRQQKVHMVLENWKLYINESFSSKNPGLIYIPHIRLDYPTEWTEWIDVLNTCTIRTRRNITNDTFDY